MVERKKRMVKLAFDVEGIDVDLPAREQARYTFTEASGYVGIPRDTMRSWFLGTTYGKDETKSDFAPVLKPADPKSRLLSFDNLVEAYILRQFRVKDKLALRAIARAIEYAERDLGIKKPLLSSDLLNAGKSLFVKSAGKYYGITDGDVGQMLMPHAHEFFERLEYADKAVKTIYPLTRTDIADSPKIISISPEVSFGRSVIHRRRVATSVVFERYFNGDSVRLLSEDYDCEEDEIEEAIRAEVLFANVAKRAA